MLHAQEPSRARPEAMEGGGCADHSHATPRPVPVGPARADPSRAFSSAVMARRPLTRRNLLSARKRPATHHRRRISPSRQRVTRAVTRRVTLSADSIGLVVASVRRTTPGTPGRTTGPGPEGPRGLRPETFRRVATDSCRSAAPIASFVSRAMTGGQGPECGGGRVVMPHIGPEGADRWRGWELLRHRRETKAFPRMEHRGGLVAHAPAYSTPMRGRATISISPRSSGSARDNSSPGRSRPSCRRPRRRWGHRTAPGAATREARTPSTLHRRAPASIGRAGPSPDRGAARCEGRAAPDAFRSRPIRPRPSSGLVRDLDALDDPVPVVLALVGRSVVRQAHRVDLRRAALPRPGQRQRRPVERPPPAG